MPPLHKLLGVLAPPLPLDCPAPSLDCAAMHCHRVPGLGERLQVLNQTSAWWFANTAHIVPSALLSTPDPNVSIMRKCKVFPVEFVCRGFMTGGAGCLRVYVGGGRGRWRKRNFGLQGGCWAGRRAGGVAGQQGGGAGGGWGLPSRAFVVWGAGLCVRRQVATRWHAGVRAGGGFGRARRQPPPARLPRPAALDA